MFETLIDFDRELLLAVNGSDSLFLDRLVRLLTNGLTWIPLYLSLFYMVMKNNDNFRRLLYVLLGAGLCILIAGTLNDEIVKPLVARWRPTHDPQIGTLVDIVDGYRGGKYGFFSAHACNTFSIAVFFSLLVRSRLLTVGLVLWSFVNCWTRLYLGVHFPGDILVGLLWGGIVGTAVYLFYQWADRHYSKQVKFISSQYTNTGYLHSDVDVVILVLVLLLLYALFRACFMLSA